MLNNQKVTLSELLRDFNNGLLGKHAEEGVITPAQPVAVQEDCPVCGTTPCECVEPEADDAVLVDTDPTENDETSDLEEAAAEVNEKQEEAIDAAKALRDMADAYIARHDDSLEKEAALFGEIFAKSAMLHMRHNNDYYGEDMHYDYNMAKHAAEAAFAEAYDYTLGKIAAESAYYGALEKGASSEEAEIAAAKAVSDAAAAAKSLVEHISDCDEEDAEAVAGQAAADAYQQTMQELGAQQAAAEEAAEPTPEQMAAQGAYDEAMQQMQPMPAPAPAEAMPEVSNNAYNIAMQQLGQQQ